MYLLDTDTVIYLLNGHPRVAENFKREYKKPKALSIITYGELVYGCCKSQSVVKNLAKLRHATECYRMVDVTRPIMECFGEVKASLEKSGTPLDAFDLLIGCTALTMNYAIVTNNVKHYQKIPGLKVVNWAN